MGGISISSMSASTIPGWASTAVRAECRPRLPLADFDSDADVDLLDVAASQNTFTGGE